MKCTNCQNHLEPDVKFCPQCGTPVKREDPPIEAKTETIAPATPEEVSKSSQEPTEETVFIPAKSPPLPPGPAGETETYVSLLPEQDFSDDTESSPDSVDPEISEDTESAEAFDPPQAADEEVTTAEQKQEHFSSPPIPPTSEETEAQGRVVPPSQHTMDAIDLAVAHEMQQAPTVFEDPPLYIPQPKRNPLSIIITLVIVLVLVGGFVLFATGKISLPSFTSQSPMVLSGGTSNIAYGMPRDAIEDELGTPAITDGNHSTYENGIIIRYRNSQAVRMELTEKTPSRWHTSGNISIGDSRSDIFKAYGTDHLVSVLKDLGRISDAAEISTQSEYLIPYQMYEGNLVQINTIHQENYENNPLSYFWVAIHLNDQGLVDTIVVGDSIGVFESNR